MNLYLWLQYNTEIQMVEAPYICKDFNYPISKYLSCENELTLFVQLVCVPHTHAPNRNKTKFSVFLMDKRTLFSSCVLRTIPITSTHK